MERSVLQCAKFYFSDCSKYIGENEFLWVQTIVPTISVVATVMWMVPDERDECCKFNAKTYRMSCSKRTFAETEFMLETVKVLWYFHLKSRTNNTPDLYYVFMKFGNMCERQGFAKVIKLINCWNFQEYQIGLLFAFSLKHIFSEVVKLDNYKKC